MSLTKTIKMYPAIGWVRANNVANEDLLTELNEIRKENALFRTRISEIEIEPTKKIEGLAGLDEFFTINGDGWTDDGKRFWKSTLTWKKIFYIISPYLVKTPNEEYVKIILKQELIKKENPYGRSHEISDQDFKTISLQLKALGLINTKYTQTVEGGMALWQNEGRKTTQP